MEGYPSPQSGRVRETPKPQGGIVFAVSGATIVLYITAVAPDIEIMFSRARRMLLLGLHQLTIALGILLLPVAILARQAGLRLPISRLVEATGEAYDRASQ